MAEKGGGLAMSTKFVLAFCFFCFSSCTLMAVYIFWSICTMEFTSWIDNTGPTPPASVAPSMRAGSTAVIDNGLGECVIPVNDAAMNEYMKCCLAKDSYGVMQMVLSGRAFVVDRQTKCSVLEQGYTTHRVRILEGKNAGLAGVVPVENVRLVK